MFVLYMYTDTCAWMCATYIHMHMHILRVGEEKVKCDIEEGLVWQRQKKQGGGRDGGRGYGRL